MLQQRIEEASLNAWPGLQLRLYDGWLLKFAHGYTKRANSVNVLSDSTIDLPEKVAVCERFYTDRGLPPIFRLTSFNAPPGLDQSYLASFTVGEDVVSCGLGVLEDKYIGLFDLVTGSDERSKGYGSRFIHGLLEWAISEGARYAYLQVMENNSGARRLYERLGFRESYRYWYWVHE